MGEEWHDFFRLNVRTCSVALIKTLNFKYLAWSCGSSQCGSHLTN